ncbi:beta-lactamase/transpeptidase-like protein [Mycena maculata]|uniref:Beta-lactamase/transpeptidase-like protein n=1 Tax=Mycena maculata TaxID=230809 RepID=A0AAD7HQ52_9AGAR|nr:beta-lactamase/transpeptidase-like protein [Mycena maculata]
MFHFANFGLLSVATGSYYSEYWTKLLPTRHDSETEKFSCRPFLPNIFAQHPPSIEHPSIASASQKLGRFLSTHFAAGDIDSLSVAVVSADGWLFEGNYGVVRVPVDESTRSLPPTTSDSMYRTASVSKLFNVLEGHILAERGALSWDDPVEKYIPGFKHNAGSLTSPQDSLPSKKEPITLFQLATHMSGLERDWPPGNVANWPHDFRGAGPPPTNGLPFPQAAALVRSVAENRIISPPFVWPIYSNAGTGLLGLSLLEADRVARNVTEAVSYADLVRRDILDPLGMNGTHSLVSERNKDLIVVPSIGPEVADQDLLDSMNPAAGQFLSLRDLVAVTQTLVDPEHPKSVIRKATMDKWLLPVHSFDEDDWTESGFIWEIIKAPDSNKRLRKVYWKLGAMVGYHAALAIHPWMSYGVVVLLAGHFPDSAALAYSTFEIFQPAIDQALADASETRYAGDWVNEDRNSSVSIAVSGGTLYVDRFIVDDVDILAKFGPSVRVALRWMQNEEFRLDLGLPFYNGKRHLGCYSYWAGLDAWGMRNGAALNAIYFSGAPGSERRLQVPAIDVELARS